MQPAAHGRTRWAERIDRLGLSLFVMAAFSCLFFALWREAAPAFLASGALSALLLPPLLRRETRAAQSRRSRQCRALRAEAALDALLLLAPGDAAAQAARWLQSEYPLKPAAPSDGCVPCRLHEKSAVVFFLQKTVRAETDDLLPLLRRAKAEAAPLCLICAACDFSDAARAFAETADPRAILFDRRLTAALAQRALPEPLPTPPRCRPRLRPSLFSAVLRRSACPRYALVLLLTALGFARTRQLPYLVCSAACALLLIFSLAQPRKRRFPEVG